MHAHVITVSDRVSSGTYEDRTGPVLADWLTRVGFRVTRSSVPDGRTEVTPTVEAAIASGARVILTTGGTGITPRDQTPEAVASLLSVETPGVIEAVRAAGRSSGVVGAALSRGVAGLADGPDGRCFLATLPGSLGAVRDAVEVLDPLLDHLVDQLDGAGH